MVLQKRLETGSVGYHIPTAPRFPRSARGKRSPPKKVMNSQMRAFDLLATVAGEILAERDNAWTLCETTGITSPVNEIKQEQLDNGSPFKSDVFDQGSCDENSFAARLVSHGQVRHIFEENLNNPEERSASLALVKTDASKKDAFAMESIPKKCFSKEQSSSLLRSCECELHGQIMTPLQAKQTTGSLKVVDAKGIRNLEDSMDMDSSSAPALVSSDSSVEIPPCGDCFSARSSSFHSIRDAMELHVDRDDDENSSDRTHCGTIHSKAFKPHCTGEHRVRKIMTSNYWKADRELLGDGEPSIVDVEMKPVFRNRKICYTRQRTQRRSFKRGKFIERSSFTASNGGFCGKDISDSQGKDGIKIDTSDRQADANGANGRSTTSQNISYESADHPVKMSIKSFKVPELFIEIPANATVGSLKRTVMEAVSAILSSGLRVGVLLQGKKMRDDNKTLLQAGISHTDKLDSLGFTLEPNPTQAPLLHHFNSYEPETLNKIHAPAAPAPNQDTSEGSAQPTANPTTICPESDHDSVHSPTPSSPVDKIYDNSKALVLIPSMNAEGLAVVSHRNSRRSDMAQRRIRRPFSVSEVEALVQAVEKLGTGRWRDVKLRAFDSAKHRTYVDLKDKWKTLVHTARISPQQRRGEQVPQELLDRVLLAHAYWSQQQAKLQQVKPIGQVEPCLHKLDAAHEVGGGGCRFNHV